MTKKTKGKGKSKRTISQWKDKPWFKRGMPWMDERGQALFIAHAILAKKHDEAGDIPKLARQLIKAHEDVIALWRAVDSSMVLATEVPRERTPLPPRPVFATRRAKVTTQ